jgi:hypothetical protein
MGEFHGDEPEIEANYLAQRQAYEDEHADDWKYSEERFSEPTF